MLTITTCQLPITKGIETAGQWGRSPQQYWVSWGERIFSANNSMPSLSAGYTHPCIVGLQQSSPDPTCTKALGFTLDPTGELSAFPRPLVGGRGCQPSQEPNYPGSALWAGSWPCLHNVDFIPMPLPITIGPTRPTLQCLPHAHHYVSRSSTTLWSNQLHYTVSCGGYYKNNYLKSSEG